MPDFDVKEKRFEQDIEEYLVTEGGYQKGDPRAFDREKALDVGTSCGLCGQASPKRGHGLRKSMVLTVSASWWSAFAGK